MTEETPAECSLIVHDVDEIAGSTDQNSLRIGPKLLYGLRQFTKPRDRDQTACSSWVRARLHTMGLIEIDTKKLGVGTGWRFKLTKRGREILRANQSANLPDSDDELF